MKRYFGLLGLISLAFLVMYLIAEALHIPVLSNPKPLMSTPGITAAIAGVGLLIADVLLPTPSSLVMVAHGAFFGIALGTALSLLGRAGSFLFGYYLGKNSVGLVAKFISPSELEAANRSLNKWGLLAIIGTRPLPILSETISIAAGLAKMPIGRSLLAAVVGSIPEALLFAVTGAVAGSFINTSYVFIGVIVFMLVFWAISAKYQKRSSAVYLGAQ